ncbi:MAG: Exodeoxyribonuclease III [Immundisolibacter sp.]|nr:Exodeoxyribonuclease III [Immundisolibacter sp.]
MPGASDRVPIGSANHQQGVLKVATWNVNSLRVRLPQLLDWLERAAPDIVGLQETKVADEEFPVAQLAAAGYRAVFVGQRTYNGVALLSREPPGAPLLALPGRLQDEQKRFVAARFGALDVVCAYVPNGSEVGSDKYAYKLGWLEDLRRYLQALLRESPKVLVMGDFNIAPADIDVHDPVAWQGQVLVSDPERAALAGIMALGLHDTFRHLNPDLRAFTWWDYRAAAFRRDHGLRIDHILASTPLLGACRACRVELDLRRAERPSDHAPVLLELDAAALA